MKRRRRVQQSALRSKEESLEHVVAACRAMNLFLLVVIEERAD